MIEELRAWLLARTARERLLLSAAALLALAAALGFGYQAAAEARTRARADLAAAERALGEVRTLAREPAQTPGDPIPASDGTVRGMATAGAQALQLTVTGMDPQGPNGVRVAFAEADHRAVIRWISLMGRQGVVVGAAKIARVGDSDVVSAVIDISKGG